MIAEKKFAFIRILSLSLEIFFGFLQPAIFIKFLDQPNYSYLLVLYGCAIYFIFMDAGFSKILYAQLRELYIQKKDYSEKIREAFSFYISIFLIILIAFLLFAFVLKYFFQNSIPVFVVALLALSITSNIIFSFTKSIFAAINQYTFFENLDILRKCFNIISILTITIDQSLSIAAVFLSSSSIIMLVYPWIRLCKNELKPLPQFNFKGLQVLKNSFDSSKKIISFSITEAIIYNAGYILIPVIYANYELTEYSLWMKIFAGIASLMRLATDINIHRITEHYFNSQLQKTFRNFIQTLLLSVFIMLTCFTCFVLFKNTFYAYWTSNIFSMNNSLVIALLFLLVGNSIQNLAGTFLLSTGKGFKYLQQFSFIVCFIQLSLYIISYYFNISFYVLMIGLQVIYFFMAFFYVVKALKVINQLNDRHV